MDLSTLTRNREKVRGNLVKLDDHSVIAREGCKVFIPQRYVNKGLAGVGETVWSVGEFVMTTDSGYYCAMLVPGIITLTPTEVRQVKLDGNAYYELAFAAGSTVIESTWIPKSDTCIPPLFNELVINGNIPYGFSLFDLMKCFHLAPKYAGFKMGANPQVFETIINIIARDPDDLNKQYRGVPMALADVYKKPPTIVGLRNPAVTSTNTVAKLIGSYFQDGIVSSLINPSDRVEGVEALLRS